MLRIGTRAKGLALLTLIAAVLAGATQAFAVDQEPLNGCTSPETYFGAVTSPSFNTGSGAASLSFANWWEVESVDPSRDPMTVQYSLDPGIGNPRSWADIDQINNTFPPSSGPDLGFSNNGLLTTPTFGGAQTFTLPAAAVSKTNVQVRIVFESTDQLYNGFRGLGVDNISVNTGGGSTNLTQGFEGALSGWVLDAAPAAGTPGWQVIANGNTIAVKSPEIAPDLVTLPSGDNGSLPVTLAGSGTHYAWFGDPATGTYCGPDFANRFQTPPFTPPTTTQQLPPKHLADLPAPVVGKEANVEPVSGTVLVGVKAGSAIAGRAHASQKGIVYVPLSEAKQIPVGSYLDTRKGTVALQTSTGSAGKTYLGNFSKGLFRMKQSGKKSAKGLSDLILQGGKFSSCKAKKKKGKKATAAISKKALRKLKGSAKGKFRTSGRYGAATVRGTKWTVTDRCDGTLTEVQKGVVTVRDFRRHKTVTVKAGKKYLAKAPH